MTKGHSAGHGVAGPSTPTSSPFRENVLIAGLRRSGKSSIIEVVYKSLPPDDSLFLESTMKCQPFEVDTFQPVRIWDGTGNAELPKPQATAPTAGTTASTQTDPRGQTAWGTGGQLYWIDCSAVIFVIDSQDDLYDAIDRLNDLIVDAYAHNPTIHFHIFVHKVDGHSIDYRYDTLQNIQSRVADHLADASASFIFAPTAHEIMADAAAALERRESFDAAAEGSSVPQTTDPHGHRPMYGTSASNFHSLNGQPSSFGPDLERDVRLSFHSTSIYNPSVFVACSRVQMALMNVDVSRTLESICNGLAHSCKFEKVYLFDVPTKTYIAADASPFDENNFEAISEYLNFLVQFSGLYRSLGQQDDGHQGQTQEQGHFSSSTVRLSPDTTLGFHQISHHLALTFIIRTDIHLKHAGMIDFNVAIARKAINDVYATCHA